MIQQVCIRSHALMNLSYSVRICDKMLGEASHFISFLSFDKCNKTWALMLTHVCHLAVKCISQSSYEASFI